LALTGERSHVHRCAAMAGAGVEIDFGGRHLANQGHIPAMRRGVQTHKGGSLGKGGADLSLGGQGER
ncbi:MAG: hypothetical protein RLZZ126_562, partial [Pseudomonadota bacterium]